MVADEEAADPLVPLKFCFPPPPRSGAGSTLYECGDI